MIHNGADFFASFNYCDVWAEKLILPVPLCWNRGSYLDPNIASTRTCYHLSPPRPALSLNTAPIVLLARPQWEKKKSYECHPVGVFCQTLRDKSGQVSSCTLFFFFFFEFGKFNSVKHSPPKKPKHWNTCLPCRWTWPPSRCRRSRRPRRPVNTEPSPI